MDVHLELPAPGELPAPVRDLFPAGLAHGIRRLSLAAGMVTFLVGCVVFLGWTFDVDVLKSLVPGFAGMKANTALGFMGAGAAIVAGGAGEAGGSRRARVWSAAAAAIPLLLGLLTVAQYAFRWDLGVDQLLFRDTTQGVYPGRMAPTSAVCFVFLGLALLFAGAGRRRVAAILSGVPMLVGFLALLGYVFGVSSLYRVPTFTGMPLHTALGFVVASIGVRLLGPTAGLVPASSSAGGALVRRLLPQAITALLLLGWVELLGERAGLYGTDMGLAITTAGAVVIVAGLIERTARSLHRVDVDRLGAEQALRALNAQLEDRVRERTAELAASEERFRSLAEASFEALVVHDGSVIVEVNRVVTRMFGYEREELIGRLDVEMLLAPEFHAFLQAAIEAGGEARADIETIRKDGTRFPASASVRHAEYGGRPMRVMAIRDITHRKEIEATLRAALEREQEATRLLEAARDEAIEASRMKSNFLANMSHEIRTPMNAVIGMTGLLLDTSLTRQQRDFALAVRGAGEGLLEIINDILDFSKIEAGKLRIEPADFELRLVVEEVVDLLASRAHEKGLELATIVERDVPAVVRGDPGRLRQILTNLAANAVKFTDRGEVVIRLERTGSAVPDQTGEQRGIIRFEVADTGIGISPEGQRHVFESFHQVDSSSARRHGGTGLGLAISKQLVELMGGEIGVRSEPGAGSTFWFTLPMAAGDAAGPVSGASRDLAGLRVLVVDDNVTARAIVVQQLAAWDIRAEGTASGVEALALLRSAAQSGAPFDVALVDWRRMDGPALAAAISADPAIASTRLVILRSSQHHGERDAIPGNVSGYLTKPIRESQLRSCLERVMEGGQEPVAPVPGAADVAAPDRVFPGRLLVAEDNPVNQVVALRMLERLGYRADAVGNGAEAVEALSRIDYAAVLMDCQMPELDGFEATREIRARQPQGRRTPVIAMTADAMREDEQRCLAAGMDDYLSKPIRSEQLAVVLRRWVPVPEDMPSWTEEHPEALPGP